jgi:metacaspase-1
MTRTILPRARFFSAIAALFALTSVTPARAEDRALMIGVENYNKPVSPLPGTLTDARMMAEVATKVWNFKPEQVKMLFNEEASVAGIKRAIETWLIAGTRPGDRVVLYFSGHGSQTKDLNGDEEDGMDETIVGWNRPGEGGRAIMLVDDEIREYLKRMPGRQIIVVVDSCHSGTITRGAAEARDPMVKLYEPEEEDTRSARTEKQQARTRMKPGLVKVHPNVIAFSASASTQLSLLDGTAPRGQKYSVFTKRFTDGLLLGKADPAGTGSISVTGMLDYVRRETKAYCDAKPKSCTHANAAFGMTPELEAPDKWLGLDLLKWTGQAQTTTTAPVASARPQQQPRPSSVPVAAPVSAPIAPVVDPVAVVGTGNIAAPVIELTNNGVVKVGDTMRVSTTSPTGGYVIVLDVADDGTVVQLFPSQKCNRPTRQLRPNAALMMPDPTYGCAFQATSPGVGKIVTIISEDNVPVDQLLGKHKSTMTVGDGAAYLAELSRHLHKTWRGDKDNRSPRYATASARYEIKP